MSQIIDLAHQMEAAYKLLLQEVEAEKSDQAKTRKSLNDRKKSLDDRETSLSEKEVELKVKAETIEAKFSKVRSDEQVQAQYNEVLTLKELAEKKLKEANNHEAEADLKLTWVENREKAVTERETTYKQKIEKEYQEKLKGLLK
jgi:hypothetical protein